jgi:hypothetical protein
MIEKSWAQHFAAEWIAAWNAHNLERVLAHYRDDFEMRSPLIVELMGVASGVLKGKSAIRPYWERGLAAHPGLQFELHCVLIGVDSIAIYYRSTPKSRMVAEVLKFGDDGQIVSGSALYA